AHYSLIYIFNAAATPEIYTLSLHDALPISRMRSRRAFHERMVSPFTRTIRSPNLRLASASVPGGSACAATESISVLASSGVPARSEEHTSELQSRFDLVCRLLLEKKNQNQK